MISDGDSKTFKLLSNQLPYGASNLVSKHECVGHVQKRMGMALREKAKGTFVNERGERVRMRGKEWLTDKTIKLLTCYYGKAIRSNTSDWAAMQDAVWAVFTTPSPQHQCCPSGQRSWCKFNRAKNSYRCTNLPYHNSILIFSKLIFFGFRMIYNFVYTILKLFLCSTI